MFSQIGNIDENIFDDPEAMLKWIDKQSENESYENEENQNETDINDIITDDIERFVDKNDTIIETSKTNNMILCEEIEVINDSVDNSEESNFEKMTIERDHVKRLKSIEEIFQNKKASILNMIKLLNQKIAIDEERMKRLSFLQIIEKRNLKKEIEQLQNDKNNKKELLKKIEEEFIEECENENKKYLSMINLNNK